MERKKELVILVNNSGRKTGVAEKIEAHRKGLLHRAFSIFILNSNGEMLLQKRSRTKYHFAGLWSNACCSHPRPGEKVLSAARRRLKEELGITASLQMIGHVTYSLADEHSGLIEKEFDYILKGNYKDEVNFNNEEVEEVKWISGPQLKNELKSYPHSFTPWFHLLMKERRFKGHFGREFF